EQSDGEVFLDFISDIEKELDVILYKVGKDGTKSLIDRNVSGTFTNLIAGDYELDVKITIEEDTDDNCHIVKQFSVTQPEAPLTAYAGVVKDVSCWQKGDSPEPASQIRITNVSGGTPPYEYNIDGEWKGGSDRFGYMSNDGYV